MSMHPRNVQGVHHTRKPGSQAGPSFSSGAASGHFIPIRRSYVHGLRPRAPCGTTGAGGRSGSPFSRGCHAPGGWHRNSVCSVVRAAPKLSKNILFQLHTTPIVLNRQRHRIREAAPDCHLYAMVHWLGARLRQGNLARRDVSRYDAGVPVPRGRSPRLPGGSPAAPIPARGP